MAATDPLARLVPADQHLVLFPNFSALAEQIGDGLAQQGTIIMDLAQPRTPAMHNTRAPSGGFAFAFRHRHNCRIARDGQRGE